MENGNLMKELPAGRINKINENLEVFPKHDIPRETLGATSWWGKQSIGAHNL